MYQVAVGYLLAGAAGLSFVCQQVVNANLRAAIGSPWWAGFVSYLGGTAVMLAAALALREPLLAPGLLSKVSLVSWSGGLFGAIYIAISILLLPRLGAGTLIAIIVAGQMIGALLFDHFGLLGVPQHPATLTRVAGAALLVLGAVLVRL